MKTSELTGRALDWAVANCEGLTCFGYELTEDTLTIVLSDGPYENFSPSREWAQGGAIIEREMLTVKLLHGRKPVLYGGILRLKQLCAATWQANWAMK